jgi:hypothetical protein
MLPFMVAPARRLAALFVAVVTLLSTTAFGRVLYECRMSGLVASKCCCAAEGSGGRLEEDRSRQPELERDGCCKLTADDAGRVPSTAGPESLQVLPAAVAEKLWFAWGLEAAVDQQACAVANARGPPASGPPLFLRHCSLLN